MRKIFCAAALLVAPVTAFAQSQPIETVVITASPLVGHADRFANILGKVGRDEILKQGGANIADALSAVPGVTGSSFAAGASRPVIRGFDATRVRLLENGVGSFDVSDIGPDHGVPIDPLAAESIEVVRGPATLRYGSQAIGGVVNVINNRVPLQLPEKTWTGEITGLYGSNAGTRQGSAKADTSFGDFAVHADGYVRHADDYRTPLGMQSNSFFRGDGYALGGSQFFGDKSRVGAALIRNAATYGIPGETSYIAMRQFKGLFGSSLALDQGALETLNIDAGYANYQHQEIEPGLGPQSTFLDREWDARAEALFGDLGVFNAAALGVQLQARDFSALGSGASYMNPANTRSYAIFGFAERDLSTSLDLQLGARIEQISTKGTPASGLYSARNFAPLSGSAGLVFRPSEFLTLGLTLSSAARAPALTELFAIGPHDGPQTFETGDPGLKIERANSLEASLRLTSKPVRIEASLWGSQFANFIYGDLTGRTCNDAGVCVSNDSQDLRELFYRQRGAFFWGIEARATSSLFEENDAVIEGFLQGDYVRAKFDGAGNVPRITPWHVGGGLDLKGKVFDAGLHILYTGTQDEITTGESPTNGFVSLNLTMAFRPFVESPGVEIAFVGKNLTDTIQRNHVALNKDNVVLPGRDMRVLFRMAL